MTHTSPDPDIRPAKRVRVEAPPSLASAPLSRPAAAPEQKLPKAPIASDTPGTDQDAERESRAGITEYVCPGNMGFSGVLKLRYTDFMVNEIGLDGEVIHLKTIDSAKKIGGPASGNINTTRNISTDQETLRDAEAAEAKHEAESAIDKSNKAEGAEAGSDANGKSTCKRAEDEPLEVCKTGEALGLAHKYTDTRSGPRRPPPNLRGVDDFGDHTTCEGDT